MLSRFHPPFLAFWIKQQFLILYWSPLLQIPNKLKWIQKLTSQQMFITDKCSEEWIYIYILVCFFFLFSYRRNWYQCTGAIANHTSYTIELTMNIVCLVLILKISLLSQIGYWIAQGDICSTSSLLSHSFFFSFRFFCFTFILHFSCLLYSS